MNTFKKILLMTGLLTLTSLNSINAQETDSTNIKPKSNSTYALIDNTLINKNMFFGMNYGNYVMNQPYLELGNKNFLVSTWGNYNVVKEELWEVDFTVAYKGNIPLGEQTNLILQPTVAYYTFPNSTISDCKETYLKATLTNSVANIDLRASKAFGKDSGEGEMIQLAVSKTVSPSNNLNITCSIESVYNNNYFSESSGPSHAGLGLIFAYKPLDNVSITSKINVQRKLSQNFKNLVKDEAYMSIALTYILPVEK